VYNFHRQLLIDDVRTSSFRQAVSRVVRPGDVVVDVGTGTGILSFFACEAGARRVYAIERDHAADVAAMLARQLGFADRITVLHASSAHVELPERADVLVTEMLGSLAYNEGLLGVIVDARRRFLKPDARIIPSQTDLWIAPAELPDVYALYVDWWRTPRHGYDFSLLRTFAANTLYSEKLTPDALLAAPATIMSVRASDLEDTALHGTASFRTARDGVVHGFVLGFDSILADGVTLSNAWRGARSWEQGVMPLEKPVIADAGTPVTIDLRTDDGRLWHWRGAIGDSEFEQTTALSRPPCVEVH
jgi:protein arginine N-methyltransferase 1